MIRDLIGSSLRINDKIVIDKHANVVTSNIYCDVLHSHIVTTTITERNAMEGVTLFGELRLDGALCSRQIRSPTNELHVNVDKVSVIGDIHSNCVNASTLKSVSIESSTNNAPIIVKHGLDTPKLTAQHIGAGTAAVNIVGAGLNIVSGVLTVPRTIDTTSSPSNVLTSSTMSGQLLFTCRVDIANGQRESVRLLNHLVTPTSLVFAVIGRYVGSGMPIVQSTVVANGMVDIFVTNNDLTNPIGRNTIIPIQYLVLA